MKDYLVCFKNVECMVEIGVRVGGLPGEDLRVSGTSVVHYELIRSGGGGCVGLRMCETMCVQVCIEKGEERVVRKRAATCCVYNICVCVCVLETLW